MDTGLKGRSALVLGAGGGLGGQVALDLASEGARVAALDRSATALADLVERASQRGLELCPIEADLADPDDVSGAHSRAAEEVGPIDVLFNNSGGPAPARALEIAPATWRESFEAMVLPLIRLTEHVVPSMRERRWGRVITSTSSGIVAPIPGLAASNGLRSALVGWSKTLAGEVAEYGITANVVVPGRIATGRVRSLDEARAASESITVKEVEQRSTGSIPAKRYGTPQEYSAAVVFLASAQASYINGTQIRVDGGMIPSV